MTDRENRAAFRPTRSRIGAALILLFTLFYPSLLTWAYFARGADWGGDVAKLCYGVGKALQFAFPVLIVAAFQKERWLIRRFNFRGTLSGVLFGGVVALFIFFVGRRLLASPGSLAPLVERLRAESTSRLENFGVASRGAYAVLFLFYSIVHSGLEEYYWRWFAFGRLAVRRSWLVSALVANVAFALHHVVVLGAYFGYDKLPTWIGSAGVAIGGFVWQTIYKRADSIYGAWISHALIDAGIFGLGFYILP